MSEAVTISSVVSTVGWNTSHKVSEAIYQTTKFLYCQFHQLLHTNHEMAPKPSIPNEFVSARLDKGPGPTEVKACTCGTGDCYIC